jgi:hypothetical protein
MASGADCSSDRRENFGNTTSTSTPSYRKYCDPSSFGVWGCSTFRLHHGTTLSSPLVDEWTSCSQGTPNIATQQPAPLAPGEQGATAAGAAAAAG